MCAALDALQERTGLDIPVHVDGASGAMIAPFLDEDLVWDFRLPRVASINTSGHKYGLVYPGVGWALWRDAGRTARGTGLPRELPGRRHAHLRAELLPAGRPGRRAVLHVPAAGPRGLPRGAADRARRGRVTRRADRGAWATSGCSPAATSCPVFAFTTAPGVTAYDVFDVSRRLRERGWLVPAYTFPPNREDLSVLRVVCRNGFSADLAELFMEDLTAAAARTAPPGAPVGPSRSPSRRPSTTDGASHPLRRP